MVNDREEQDRIEQFTGLKRSRAFGLRKLYLEKGIEAVKGKPKNAKALLTKSQLQEVADVLAEVGSPIRLGYNSPFWTTAMLADYIKQAYGVQYKSKTSYYVIFKQIKFTYHKPGRVFEKRDEQEVAKWRKQTKKILTQAWKDSNTVILCGDEMILSTQITFQKIWLPQGTYPKIEVSNTRKNISIYGFLNLKSGRDHAFLAENQTMYITKRMLQRIRRIYPRNNHLKNKVRGKKILLLWDQPGWHRGSVVQEYIRKDGQIQIVFFPKYSPEENPQEHVWKSARSKVTHNRFIPNLNKVAEDFIFYLNRKRFFYSMLGFGPLSKC